MRSFSHPLPFKRAADEVFLLQNARINPSRLYLLFSERDPLTLEVRLTDFPLTVPRIQYIINAYFRSK